MLLFRAKNTLLPYLGLKNTHPPKNNVSNVTDESSVTMLKSEKSQ